jgi:hypothetical protein
MSISLPIGPLQITYTAGTTTTIGTIQVNAPPAGSPAGTPASVVFSSAGNPTPPPITQHATVTTSSGAIEAGWNVAGSVLLFTGIFSNNLRGSGTLTESGPNGLITQHWTAQLGEKNVPIKIAGVAAAGSITIAGNQVTFNVGSQSATANVDPATGLVTSGAGFSLGIYTGVSGRFTSNTSGSGSFGLGSKRQGGANWSADMSS